MLRDAWPRFADHDGHLTPWATHRFWPEGAAMPLWDLFLTMLWFFLFITWVWLVVVVLGDLFRTDMSGWGKALWAVFIIILPFVGVLAYVIARHGTIREPSWSHAMTMDRGHRGYAEAVTGSSVTNEIGKLAELRDRGILSNAEFEARKSALLR
jgi:hypothetical protein